MSGNEITSRERVLLALSHRATDRVPVDFMATPETWTRLLQHLDLQDPEEALCFLGVDVRHPRQRYAGPPAPRHPDGSWTDTWGVRRKPVAYDGGVYEEIVENPLGGIRDASELAAYPWPKPEWWDAGDLLRQIRALDHFAIALPEFGDPGGMFEIAWYMRGMEQLLLDMTAGSDIAYEIMRRVTDFYLAILDRVMAVAGDRIDLIWTSDDIAHQRGPLISEPLWRESIAPHHQRLNARIHELGARVMYHSCGAVSRFIPGLMEIGVDVLDALQFSAAGLHPCEIKKSFGDRLCFHGGIDVQSTLPFGTEEEVRKTACERIEILGRGGGYILAPTHNIQADTPPANIVAMYAEAGSLALISRVNLRRSA